jgi:signal transduction histidine kinase
MTPEEAGRLFNDFARIKNEKTRHILGSGLGLSTVKKLVTLYGGEVSLTSRADAGSTFAVTLAGSTWQRGPTRPSETP